MWKCKKEKITIIGARNPITIERKGFAQYIAVQYDGRIIAKGIKLRKYYNPYDPDVPGSGALPGYIRCDLGYYDEAIHGWVNGDGHYELRLENPKNLNHFETVCVWR